MLFEDRRDAGRELAGRVRLPAGADAVVLGLARGGVVVAAEVAAATGAPLEVIVTRKLGAPGNPEYAIGAVAEGGALVLNEAEIRYLGIPDSYVREESAKQERSIHHLADLYRSGRPLPDLRSKTAVLVDDGIATGYTMRAAVEAARLAGASAVVVAVPVGPAETVDDFRQTVESVVCVATPEPFFAVGSFYADFSQVSDEEVRSCLAEAAARAATGRPASPPDVDG